MTSVIRTQEIYLKNSNHACSNVIALNSIHTHFVCNYALVSSPPSLKDTVYCILIKKILMDGMASFRNLMEKIQYDAKGSHEGP